MKRSKIVLLFFLFQIYIVPVKCQTIPAARLIDWKNAGLRQTVFSTTIFKNIIDFGGNGNGIFVNDNALQNAINSLQNKPGIIYFPTGIYQFNNSILLKSGVILRGNESNNTTLRFNLNGQLSLLKAEGNATDTISPLLAEATKGNKFIQVVNPSLFNNKDFIKIFQNDAGLVTDAYALFSVGQIVQIDSIIDNKLFIASPLYKDYTIAENAKVRKLKMLSNIGIECLKIKRLDATVGQTSNVYFNYCTNAWVRGVDSDSCNFAHVQIANSIHLNVSENYFHGAFAYGSGGKGYGISCEYTSGNCLIQNNVFRNLRHSMLIQSGANANVFSYNYSINPFKTDTIPYDLSGDIVLHGNYPYLNLFEGNIVQNIIIDFAHGKNGPFNTFFRNRAELYGFFISPFAGDSMNIVGTEITNTGFQKGNYLLHGNGHFEFGNNKNDTIIPASTATFTEASLLYNTTPTFWNNAGNWPSISFPNVINAGTIPAKVRKLINTNIALCTVRLPTTYVFNGNGNWSDANNWQNNILPVNPLPMGSEIIINPINTGSCILDIPYTITATNKFTVVDSKKLVIKGNLTIID